MKKFSILLIFAVLALLLGLRFLGEEEVEPRLEPKKETERASTENTRELAQASTAEENGEDQSPLKSEKLREASPKTLWEKRSFPERLQVADLDMPLVFEGQVGEELKQVILADIHMIYNAGTTYKKYDWSGRSDNPVFNFSDESYVSSATINLRASQVPDIVHKKLGRIVHVDGVDNIVVPVELISAYEEAWEARKSDPIKYESLGSFIDWLNTATMEQLRADNPYWLFGYDGVSDAYPERAAEMRESLLPDQRKDLRVGHPSILEFTYVDREVLKQEGAVEQLPVGVTLADGKYVDENEVPYQQALFLYDGDKWHIAFAPPGT